MNPTGFADREAPESLPAGWACAPVSALGTIEGGGTPNTSDLRYWTSGTIPWVSPKDMKWLEIADAQDRITPLAVEESSTRLVGPGAVLLVIRSGILQHTLPVGIAMREVALNQDMKAIQPHEGIDSKYLAYALRANQTRILNECCKTGTTVQSIEIPQFKRYAVPLAPSAEQVRIADRIDELFTDLAAGVAALERVKRNLTRYRAAVLHAAVTGRLTEAWRKQHGTPEDPGPKLLERILVERRRQWEERTLAKYKKAGKPPPKNWKSRYPEPKPPKPPANGSNLPALSEGWCWTSIGQCFVVRTGGTPARSAPEFWNGNVPWVSSGEVRFCRIKSTGEHITAKGVDSSNCSPNPPGTVLVGMIGEGRTRGQAAILDIEAANNQNSAAILVADTPIPPEFIFYYFWSQYDSTRRLASGGNQPALSKDRIEGISVPLPPLAEQSAIVETVNEKLSQIDALEAEVEHGLARAARLRQAILKVAFEGRLVPQDPSDESASVLLERIRAATNAELLTRAQQPRQGNRKNKKTKSAPAETSGDRQRRKLVRASRSPR